MQKDVLLVPPLPGNSEFPRRIETPIDSQIVRKIIFDSKLPSIGKASIREIRSLINSIELATGSKFIRMEMGVPGLPSNEIGIEAEINAIRSGITNLYPDIEGIPSLKNEISRFVKLFLLADVPAKCCLPSTGSTNGSFASFLMVNRLFENRNTTLFLDPGFPVHKQQLKTLGMEQQSLDVYNYRGDNLKNKLKDILSGGKIASIMYSNPNNPTWICFTEKELKIIGELAAKYDVIVLEDLAYLNMDFRKDYSHPGTGKHQPSVSKYTDNYILLISSSKIFSYAGQRVGAIAISPKLFERNFNTLQKYYSSENFGHAMIYGAAYAISAGVTHSTQFAFEAMLRAVNNGEYDFIKDVKVYGERAKVMKRLFIENGFTIVYDKDDGVPIADGFYFTVAYPGFSGVELIEELLYYGVSAISLANTGSLRDEGIRACVSLVRDSDLPELENRLKLFHENHKL